MQLPGPLLPAVAKVARLSGARVISNTPAAAWTRLTRRPARNAPFVRSGTIFPVMTRRNRARESAVSCFQSRKNPEVVWTVATRCAARLACPGQRISPRRCHIPATTPRSTEHPPSRTGTVTSWPAPVRADRWAGWALPPTSTSTWSSRGASPRSDDDLGPALFSAAPAKRYRYYHWRRCPYHRWTGIAGTVPRPAA